MSGFMQQRKLTLSRSSTNGKRRWQHHEEIALVDFLKRNRDFEKPFARVYYTRFLFESGLDTDWRLVRCKTRNMRVTYRKAKEYECKQAESNSFNIEDLKREVFKMCWYTNEFDILFPNFLDNNVTPFSDPIFDEELSKDEQFSNIDNTMRQQKNVLRIKKESPDEDAKVKQTTVQESHYQGIFLKEMESKQTPYRNRANPIRKWQRKEEIALIDFLKQNGEIEKPTARLYYLKFIEEIGMDIEWHLVRSKVRNMRVAYRKAKEHEIREKDSTNCNNPVLKNDVLKICWFLDDFDKLYPNEMDNSTCLRAYKTPDLMIEDDFSKDEIYFNIDNSSNNFSKHFLPEEDSTASLLSNNIDDDTTMQTNIFNIKRQGQGEFSILRQKELELAREKLNFEKEKFRQEIRLKEKEIDSEEKLKVMEIQMKERIAIKKLEIEEMIALRSSEKPENSYNNIYQNLV